MCGRASCAARGSDRGAVTVESAFSLLTLVTVVALLLGGVSAVADQLRCTDAAREAARLVARGDRDQADQAISEIAPSDATVRITTTPSGIEVTVSVRPLMLPGVVLRGHAFAVPERGVDTAPGGEAR